MNTLKIFILLILGIVVYCCENDNVLQGGDTYGKGISVFREKVYVAGWYFSDEYENYVACYWINGEKFDLEDGISCIATSIFIE